MKIKEVVVTTETKKYETSDGRKFSTIEEAKKHQTRLDDLADTKNCRMCSNCSGTGYETYEEIVRWGREIGVDPVKETSSRICTKCSGKGYQKKQEIWI